MKLQPELDGELVLQRVGRACLKHLTDNESAARSGDAEGIHQMRVAVRRLRAFLATFAPLLPPKARREVSNELRWFGDVLGEARNLDVFVRELMAPARASFPVASEFERLSQAVERQRQTAHKAAAKAMASARYRTSVRAVKRWFGKREWRAGSDTEGLHRPLGDLAPIVLERPLRQVKKRAKDFPDQSEEQRHELRIALKKLRYAAEFLSALYAYRKTTRFIRRLRRLQDGLGIVNDVRVGHDIVAALADPASPDTGVGYAGHRILAWHERRLVDNEMKLRRHLRQLLATEPFWRTRAVSAVEEGKIVRSRVA